mgnify:CR=1 FL=1
MTDLAVATTRIAAMSEEGIDQVRQLEAAMLESAQPDIMTKHVIHGGVYCRTMNMPAGCLVTGSLIKIATTLIISGHVTVYVGGETVDFIGYNVTPAGAGRKIAVLVRIESDLTMLFPTSAKSVEEAEAEFTDEVDLLGSRRVADNNSIIITGE